MVKNPYYQQNNKRLPSDPPNYLGTVAREIWRKIVPFLESTQKIERIDTFLVETYCTNYEIYKIAYEDIKQNGIQQEMKKPIQAQGSGEILGEQSLGFKKNPAVATMKDAVDTLNRIGVQLGLTPKGRQELMEIADEKSDEDSIKDKMKDFFK
ncbi:phage terminase small subunit P27 family [Streptococcus gallolyticus]|uniref:phage terminase small subunit P27 family n=1 Tax=Streptococcus gallolyticus TaxID=315405 RepID=UPI002283DDA3|nr:phage terminase small subunit P27 family [Streptococcus gallolyticus]MCY7173666.1 phage terminase small subunit P27 family [Streptococcus gallolyticus subsp. gallolyticus]MCY7175787.1 phage terminase small subunit P27 family [Streptococcus gallolyticus subsp. gallolyticus]MCY7180241.1 phage terminase small subunit P27 family [Streptococcus gallolyticus subsp. gallolyticus]MCY7186348.1 phage terminase small subunit P27 family [Streptococcus gallolyticus subsp. gallolyticus]MCY7190072.1 phage